MAGLFDHFLHVVALRKPQLLQGGFDGGCPRAPKAGTDYFDRHRLPYRPTDQGTRIFFRVKPEKVERFHESRLESIDKR